MKKAGFKVHLGKYQDLITTKEEVRAGFIAFALEKNKRSTPFIERAKNLKAIASTVKKPEDLINIQEIQRPLLTAAGLSDKALNHLTEDDKRKAIQELIDNFLKPSGKDFVDELVFRFLLIQGDSLGGSMRNIVGALAMQRLTRSLIATLSNAGIEYSWINNNSKKKEWIDGGEDDYDIENSLKAIHWVKNKRDRILVYNRVVPIVKNNIDAIVLDAAPKEFNNKIFSQSNRYIALGELKGGIDPAGADEHWKTANSALERIRTSFKKKNKQPKTFFIAAAIESKMALEIWNQLKIGKITNAANLTDDKQIAHLCNWLINL